MTPKQKRFVAEYLIDLNATQAAKRAGYSEASAYSIGQENLTKPELAAAIAEALGKRASQAGIDALWVLNEAVDVYRAARAEDKLSEALRALDVVGKHVEVQAFKERIEHTGKDGGPIQHEQVEIDAAAFRSRLISSPLPGAATSGTGETVQ